MKTKYIPFHDRKLWVYYFLFFTGSLTLIYQALELNWIGDSVDALCVAFLVGAISIRRKLHILENSLLITFGYILPLVIRNSMRLTYLEAPSVQTFLELGLKSAGTTLGLGLTFSSAGFLLMLLLLRLQKVRKGKITTTLGS